jgi:hypothetical protein
MGSTDACHGLLNDDSGGRHRRHQVENDSDHTNAAVAAHLPSAICKAV